MNTDLSKSALYQSTFVDRLVCLWIDLLLVALDWCQLHELVMVILLLQERLREIEMLLMFPSLQFR